MTVAVIVPWRDTVDRKPARDYVLARIDDTIDPLCIVEADDPGEPFNRGRALNAGVFESDASWLYPPETLVFHDADMIVPVEAMLAAIEAVERGAALVVPFTRLVGLTGAASELVMEGRSPFGPWGADQIDLLWERKSQGGVNVLRREAFETVSGFDERFAGWGGEDAGFVAAVETLVGPVEYVESTAIHLWHAHADDRGGRQTSQNLALAQAYERAWGDPAQMAALIAQR